MKELDIARPEGVMILLSDLSTMETMRHCDAVHGSGIPWTRGGLLLYAAVMFLQFVLGKGLARCCGESTAEELQGWHAVFLICAGTYSTGDEIVYYIRIPLLVSIVYWAIAYTITVVILRCPR